MPEPKGRKPLPGSRFLSDVVAEKVRAYRLLRRMTQDDLAAGMRELRHRTWVRATVSEVERGRRNVTIDELVGLSSVLEVAMFELADPTPLEGGEPPALDIGWPEPMPPSMVREWAHGAKVFASSEEGPDGKPRVRFTAVGRLAPDYEGKS
jgi:transcriptional regulator with XRE-family HTH domain